MNPKGIGFELHAISSLTSINFKQLGTFYPKTNAESSIYPSQMQIIWGMFAEKHDI